MFLLHYWNSDLDLEVASWFPLGIDYKPVSINLMYSQQLQHIAALCLENDSEFLFMASTAGGCVGSFMRDNFYSLAPRNSLNLGFMMLLGYSPQMDALLYNKLAEIDDIKAGVAFCSLWNKTLLLENLKVIVLVSDTIFFEDESFLKSFEALLAKNELHAAENMSYFAEKFGYRRFSMAYETDDPLQLRISKLLYEMEFSETRKMVGPSPEMPFPSFLTIHLDSQNL